MAKRNRSNLWLYILIGLTVVVIGIVAWRNNSKPKGEKVSIEKVEKRTIREMVSASGKVFPVTEVKISSDVSGEVVELYVEEGDSVVVGQLMARIDPDAYQSQVERGVAGVNTAKSQAANALSSVETLRAQREQVVAQLNNAREIHKRNEKLHKEGVISDADFESSQSNLLSLEANLRSAEASIRASEQGAKAAEYSVKSAEAGLKELQTSLKRTTLYAPMGGIVSMLNVEKGERVVGNALMAGTEVVRIANLYKMEVQVEVSENDIPRVSLGDPVDIEVDAYIGRKFKGKVTQIANSANNASSIAGVALTSDQVTNFVVKIDIDRASYKDLISPTSPYPFRPGMSASVDINTNTLENVLSIPIQAVTTREKKEIEGGKKSEPKKEEEGTPVLTADEEALEVVFVVSADTVKLLVVKTGIQDDSYIELLSGVEEGDEVVTEPYEAIARKLKRGDKVIVVDKDELYKDKEK
ncbi:MAG: efflux RND transporter periplasmic adaptor subunit [Saprospirales bacterium]|jgi:HlyD family secretion protein|nr:efflux RND transporter periplasmic adaptor subunit [Saprospirales bacterium]MBK7334679.1 efflux RND transporter periplasmic adaptor subunit [Saprospirales bacterium]